MVAVYKLITQVGGYSIQIVSCYISTINLNVSILVITDHRPEHQDISGYGVAISLQDISG